jgi:mono/diheme cytochrome c family protein
MLARPTLGTLAHRPLFGLLAVLSLVGCSLAQDETTVAACEPPEQPTVGFASDVQMVFDFNCVSCHQAGAENAELNLGFGAAHADLVGVPSTQSPLLRVQPGLPSESYLMHKLEGTHLDIGGSGDPMPLGLGPLPDADLATIRTWIEECALDN